MNGLSTEIRELEIAPSLFAYGGRRIMAFLCGAAQTGKNRIGVMTHRPSTTLSTICQ